MGFFGGSTDTKQIYSLTPGGRERAEAYGGDSLDWQVLYILKRGSATASEIAQELGSDTGKVKSALFDMKSRGLVMTLRQT